MTKFRDSTLGSIVILALVCMMVTAALAGTYAMTKDTIAASKSAAVREKLAMVLPAADEFVPLEMPLPDGIAAGYSAANGAGYVFTSEVKGYGGPVMVIAGIDPDGKFTGVEMTHTETPGYGSRVGEPEYLSQFAGKDAPGQVDMLAGATVTSGALQKALNLSVQAYQVATGKASLEPETSGAGLSFAVLPGATSFLQLDMGEAEGLDAAYKAEDGSGYVFVVTTKGYGGPVTYTIGLDDTGTITGIEMGKNDETTGLGSKVGEADYLAKFVGQTDPKSVDMVANATVTSKSLRKAIGIAIERLPQAKTATGTPVAVGSASSSFAVMPNASGFTPVEADLPEEIRSVYRADDGSGFVFKVTVKGYGGPVEYTVGLASDGTITGIEMGKNDETAGLGSKVGEPDYLAQFAGQKDPKSVDMVANATVTSKSLRKALNLCIEQLPALSASTGGAVPASSSAQETAANPLFDVSGLPVLEADLAQEIDKAYPTKDGAGYIFVITVKGYGGPVTYTIGIEKGGKITGVEMGDNKETKGIGSKVGEPDYLAQFVGQTDPKSVDMVANATVTSKSLRKALNIALDATAVLEEMGGE